MRSLKTLISLTLLGCTFLPAQTPSVTNDESPRTERRSERSERYGTTRRLMRNLEERGFFGPQTLPNYPRPAAGLFPEWHPANAVLLSIQSLASVLGISSSYAQYADLIEALLPFVDVMVLYPEKEQTLLGELINRLEKESGILPYQDRLIFQPVPGPTMWLRDNGPIFAHETNGQLVLFDFSARPFIDEEEVWFTTPAEISDVEWQKETAAFIANRTRERIADATPLALLRHLALRKQINPVIKRPPISLQGGDFVTDGEGNVFISFETLQANGGDQEALVTAFQRYVGPVNVHFLFSLPGNTPKHLDMILKFVGPNTAVIAAPPPAVPNESSYMRRLRFEIETAIAYNRNYLQQTFPDLQLISIPLLPLVDEQPAQILNRLRWRIIAKVCELNQLNVMDLLGGRGQSAEYPETEERVFAAIQSELGTKNTLSSIEELQAAALHYLKTDIHNVVETNVPFQTVYRSPINTLQIVDTKGRETLILPRFDPREGESRYSMDKWETAVETAYRTARPNASFRWVQVDAAANLQGGLHCMGIVLPSKGFKQEN